MIEWLFIIWCVFLVICNVLLFNVFIMLGIIFFFSVVCFSLFKLVGIKVIFILYFLIVSFCV